MGVDPPPIYVVSCSPHDAEGQSSAASRLCPFLEGYEKTEEFRFTAAIDLASNEVAYHHLYPEELFEGANWEVI